MASWLDEVDPERWEVLTRMIPERYQGTRIEDFMGDHADVAHDVFDLCNPTVKGQTFVTVSGPMGTGKTRLAYLVLKVAWRRQRVNVQYHQCSTLVTRIRLASLGDSDLAFTINDMAERKEVQILDDFGAGNPNQREWGLLQSIVERREHYGLKTLLLTNLTQEEIEDVDGRLASRIGGGLWLEMTGDDRRADK